MENHPVLISSYDGDIALMIERYSSMLIGLCSRLLRDRHLAQDAVQETFLKAYLNRNSFRGENENSERAWLIQIAMNVCCDQMRSSWFRSVDSRISVDTLNLMALETPEEDMMLNTLVCSLPQKYRDVILMYYYQDMTAEEIASAVQKSVSVVYRRLRDARRMLRISLQCPERSKP